MWAVAAAYSSEASIDIAIYFKLDSEHLWTNLTSPIAWWQQKYIWQMLIIL